MVLQYIQWRWVTCNQNSKVTLLFDARYLRNCTRYIYSGMLIGTYTYPTQGCHFEWPWVVLSELAKYSMTRNIARSLCDSWASCFVSICTLVCVCSHTADRVFRLQFRDATRHGRAKFDTTDTQRTAAVTYLPADAVVCQSPGSWGTCFSHRVHVAAAK